MAYGYKASEREKLLCLLEKMEAAFPMRFAAPYHQSARPAGLPAGLAALYSITDGMEIDVPGTVILPREEVWPLPEKAPGGEMRRICFGHMNFGDLLCTDESGSVVQIDIEDGSEFLRWDSLLEFLEDEYESGVRLHAS